MTENVRRAAVVHVRRGEHGMNVRTRFAQLQMSRIHGNRVLHRDKGRLVEGEQALVVPRSHAIAMTVLLVLLVLLLLLLLLVISINVINALLTLLRPLPRPLLRVRVRVTNTPVGEYTVERVRGCPQPNAIIESKEQRVRVRVLLPRDRRLEVQGAL